MTISTALEFIENRSDLTQKRFLRAPEIKGWFCSGALAIAFGAAVGVPILGAVGVAMIALPTVTVGLCEVVKLSVRFAKVALSRDSPNDRTIPIQSPQNNQLQP